MPTMGKGAAVMTRGAGGAVTHPFLTEGGDRGEPAQPLDPSERRVEPMR